MELELVRAVESDSNAFSVFSSSGALKSAGNSFVRSSIHYTECGVVALSAQATYVRPVVCPAVDPIDSASDWV